MRIQRLLALALLGLASCHARWNPWGTPPIGFHRTPPAPIGVFGKEEFGKLGPDDYDNATGFQYVLQCPGPLEVSLRWEGETQIFLNRFADGNVPLDHVAGNPGEPLTLHIDRAGAGDIWFVIVEPWKTAIDVKFWLRVDAPNEVHAGEWRCGAAKP